MQFDSVKLPNLEFLSSVHSQVTLEIKCRKLYVK